MTGDSAKACVVVCTGLGRSHLYQAAIAAQQRGHLRYLITTFYATRWWRKIEYMLSTVGVHAGKRIYLRYSQEIDEERVIALPLPDLLNKILAPWVSHWPKGGNALENWLVHLYARAAARYIDDSVGIVHTRSGHSEHIIKAARRVGARIILDQYHCHPEFTDAIMQEEYEKWNIKPKKRVYTRGKERMLQDIEDADLVLTGSDFARGTLVEGGVSPERVRVLPLGVDFKLFAPPCERANSQKLFRIVYVGQIRISKGVQYLLEAYRKAQLPNAELLLVGGLRPDIESVLKRYQGFFKHVGHLPQYALPGVYASASVAVVPSLHEAFPFAILEALACGVPVIASRNASPAFQDGVQGFIVPAQDADALADRITYLYNNPAVRNQMGQSAREYVLANFSWQEYQARLGEIYAEFCR